MKNESDFNFNLLPVEVQDMIEQELDTDETITWMAQPRPALLVGPSMIIGLAGLSDVVMAAGLYFFTGIPVFVVIPILLIGLGLLCAPLWAMNKAKKVYYLLTDRRALILQGGQNFVVHSYKPGQLKAIRRKQNNDHSGSLLFINSPSNSKGLFSVDGGFYGINNVKEVHDMINRLTESTAD